MRAGMHEREWCEPERAERRAHDLSGEFDLHESSKRAAIA